MAPAVDPYPFFVGNSSEKGATNVVTSEVTTLGSSEALDPSSGSRPWTQPWTCSPSFNSCDASQSCNSARKLDISRDELKECGKSDAGVRFVEVTTRLIERLSWLRNGDGNPPSNDAISLHRIRWTGGVPVDVTGSSVRDRDRCLGARFAVIRGKNWPTIAGVVLGWQWPNGKVMYRAKLVERTRTFCRITPIRGADASCDGVAIPNCVDVACSFACSQVFQEMMLLANKSSRVSSLYSEAHTTCRKRLAEVIGLNAREGLPGGLMASFFHEGSVPRFLCNGKWNPYLSRTEHGSFVAYDRPAACQAGKAGRRYEGDITVFVPFGHTGFICLLPVNRASEREAMMERVKAAFQHEDVFYCGLAEQAVDEGWFMQANQDAKKFVDVEQDALVAWVTLQDVASVNVLPLFGVTFEFMPGIRGTIVDLRDVSYPSKEDIAHLVGTTEYIAGDLAFVHTGLIERVEETCKYKWITMKMWTSEMRHVWQAVKANLRASSTLSQRFLHEKNCATLTRN